MKKNEKGIKMENGNGIKMELVKKNITKNQCQLFFEHISKHEQMIISPFNILIRDTYKDDYQDFKSLCNLPIGCSFFINQFTGILT